MEVALKDTDRTDVVDNVVVNSPTPVTTRETPAGPVATEPDVSAFFNDLQATVAQEKQDTQSYYDTLWWWVWHILVVLIMIFLLVILFFIGRKFYRVLR